MGVVASPIRTILLLFVRVSEWWSLILTKWTRNMENGNSKQRNLLWTTVRVSHDLEGWRESFQNSETRNSINFDLLWTKPESSSALMLSYY